MTFGRTLWPGLLLAAGALLAGCAGHSPGPGAATKPARTPAATRATAPEEERDEASLEARVEAHAHFAAGIIYEMNGENERGRRELFQAAMRDPGYEPLVIDVARRLLEAQQADKAVTLLTRASSQPGASGLTYGWLGLAQAQVGKPEQAMTANRMAIKRSPRLLLGYENLAQLYFRRKEPKEALKVLDAAGRQTGVSTLFLVDLAETLAAAGRTKALPMETVKPRVLTLLTRAGASKSDEPLVLQKMADTYKTVGELGKATALYQDLLKHHAPENSAFAPLLREQLFQLYLRSGDRPHAAEQLRAILRDNPTNPQAYYLLGNLASEEKNYSEAVGYFQKALLFKPDLEPAYYDLAGVQITLDQSAQALETLQKARRQFSPNFYLEFYSGVAQAGLKEYKEAIRSYTAAELLAKTSNNTNVLDRVFYFQLGAACERAGDLAEAEHQFHHCLALSPDYAEALNYLGYMWADRGEHLEEARQMIEKAVKLEPKNAAYLDSLGWVLFRLKQLSPALDYIHQAINNSEKPDPSIYDHLGDIESALGHPTEAQAAWRKSLELEPNDQIKKKLDAARAH